MTAARHLVLAGLLAGACATASCGLLRMPGRIVGGLAHATVEGGKSLHRKAEEASARRKRAKEEKEQQELAAGEQANKQQAAAGAGAATGGGGLLPDLPPEPGLPAESGLPQELPAESGIPAGSAPDAVDPDALPEFLPPLPEE